MLFHIMFLIFVMYYDCTKFPKISDFVYFKYGSFANIVSLTVNLEKDVLLYMFEELEG